MAKHPSLPSLNVSGKEQAKRPVEPSPVDVKLDNTITLTRKEVFETSHPDSKCLIIIGSSIYDCTKWQNYHPGGHLTIRALCGKDATDAFDATHAPEIRARLKAFYYGKLADENLSDLTVEFRRITKQMKDEGLFETDYTFYYKKIAAYACLFALVLAGVFLSDKLIVHALSGMALGLFLQKEAFIGQDLVQNGITHNRIIDSYL